MTTKIYLGCLLRWMATVTLIGPVDKMIDNQTSGYCVVLGGNLMSWRSKKQTFVSRSTTNAEYRALSQGLSKMLWVKHLLRELKLLRKGHLRVWCENQSAIIIANNPLQHDRTKHVETDHFFI